MAPPIRYIGKKGLCILMTLCLLFTGSFTLFLVEESSAPVVFDSQGLSITAGASFEIKDYITPYRLNGNILVDGGSSLTIINSSVVMKPDSNINVTAGSTLRIVNSFITVDINSIQASYNLFFQVENSIFEIVDSSIIFPGTFNISSSNFSAVNTIFDQLIKPTNLGSPTLIFNSSNVYFEDCQVNNLERFKDVELLGATNFTAINTFFDLDFLGESIMVVDHSSKGDLYGVTINPGTWPFTTSPIQIRSSNAWVNIYRWLFLNVTDLLGIPLGSTSVSVKNINLNQFVDVPPQYILTYLDKGNITSTNYNITNSSGYVVLPLISDNLTRSSMPNSIFVGNYKISAYHDQYSTQMNLGLSSFPMMTPGSNKPRATLRFSDLLMSPENNTYFTKTNSDIVIGGTDVGIIRDSIYQKPQGGVKNMTFGQQGNIIVKDSGKLEFYSTGLGLEQDKTNKYYILLKNNGKLNLNKQSAILDGKVTPGEFPINIYVNDSSEITLKENSALKNIGALGVFRNAKISFDRSSLDGRLFYANGLNDNLIITSENHSQLNISALSLSNTILHWEDTNISTGFNKPFLSNIIEGSYAKNCSFTTPLTFTNGSKIELTNISRPSFFNITALDTSWINVSWWLTVIVKDSLGNRLIGVQVTIYNYSKNAKLNPTPYAVGDTDVNGEFTVPVLGGMIYYDQAAGKGRRLYGGHIGNYNVTATFSGARGSAPQSRSSGGFDVFGKNQEIVIVIPGGPDLEVVNISPDEGVKGEEMYIKATIKNKGTFNASNVKVEFWEDGRQLGDTQKIPILYPGKTADVFISQIFITDGIYNIEVHVDPDDEIGETNEKNNVANISITILNLDKPDLIPVANSLSTEPPTPIANGSEVEFSVRVRNIGNAESVSCKVLFKLFYIDVSSEIEYWNRSQILGALPAGQSRVVTLDSFWIVNRTGNYRIEVHVDFTNTNVEYNELNNTISREIEVVIGPDLTVTQITFEPKSPITREKVFVIKARIENIGPSNATDFKVGFYLDRTDNQIGSLVTVDFLNTSESKIVEKFTSISEAKNDPYTIFVVVDPDNNESETDETNNALQRDLMIIKKADLIVESIQFKYSELDNGVDTPINATIKNIGETASMPFTIRFYDGPAKGGKQIRPDSSHGSIKAGESEIFSVIWSSTRGGWHDIWVEIESTNEESKANNLLSESIYIRTKPDLYFSHIITDKDREKTQALRFETVQIEITLNNGGDTTVKNFTVEFWDGPRDEEKEPFRKEEIKILQGKSYLNKTVPHTFTTEGNHYIHVYVDPENEIDESNENNNSIVWRLLIERTAADLKLLQDPSEILPIISVPGKEPLKNERVIVDKEKYNFNFSIINVGNEEAKNVTVLVIATMDDIEQEIGNTTISEIGTIEGNTVDIDTGELTAKYDKNYLDFRKLIIWIDPENKIKESNEDNNIIEIEDAFKIIKADLQLTKIIAERNFEEVYNDGQLVTDLKEGDFLQLKALVKNAGSASANATVNFYKDGDDNPISAPITEEIEPNEEIYFILENFEISSDNDLNIEAVVTLNPIPEREQNVVNNEQSISLTIKEQTSKDEEESSFFIMLILIIIIIIICAVIGAILFMKKKREKMAECSECGALIPVDADACPKCGAEFSDEIECGECGALMKITDTNCPVCGAVFTKEAEGEEGEMPPGEEDLGKPGAPPAPPKPTAPAPSKKQVAARPKAPTAAKPPAAAVPGAPKAAAVPPPPPAAAKPAAAAAAAPAEDEKAECYRCGAIVPLSASMCPECGAEFE